MRSSTLAALIVAVAIVSFGAAFFGFQAYSRHEEEAKMTRQFEVLVSEDTARTEMIVKKFLSRRPGSASESEYEDEFNKDVESREKIIVEAKVLPHDFTPELRNGFIELLNLENDLSRAMKLLSEKEWDAREGEYYQNQFEPPTSVAAHVVIAAVDCAMASEKRLQSLTSEKHVAYAPVLSSLEPGSWHHTEDYLRISVTASNSNSAYSNQPARSLQAVDFKNLAYQLDGTTVVMRDGAFSQRENLSSYSANLDDIWYFDTTDGVPRHALISMQATGCGGSCSSTGYLFLFELRNEHPIIVQQLEFDAHANGTGASFDETAGLLRVKSKSWDGSPNCCAQRLDVVSYKWSKNGFLQSKVWVEAAPQHATK